MAKLRETETVEGAPLKSDRRARKRVSVYLHDDGTPDWDGTPAETKEKLGLGATAEHPEPVPAELVGAALQILTQIESAVVAKSLDLDPLTVARALEPPPMFARPLVDSATRVLNKYSGAWTRWADEIMLAGLLAAWQLQAFAEISRLRKEKDKENQRPPVQPDSSTSEETVPFPDALPFAAATE